MLILVLIYLFIVIGFPKIIRRGDNAYLTRYFIVPNNSFLNIYLHKFSASDDDNALHDHPWHSIGILLNGHYKEYVPKDIDAWISGTSREQFEIIRYPFVPIYREPNYIHRIELIDNEPIWTIFMTGNAIRSWGFWCPKGFVDNQDYLNEAGTDIGRGCN